MTIGKKLTISTAVLMAIGCIIASTSVWAIRGLNTRFDRAVSKTARKLQLMLELNQVKSDMFLAQRGYVLAAFMKSPDKEVRRGEFDAEAAKMHQKIVEIHPLMSVPEGKRLLVIYEKDLAVWMQEYKTVFQLCESDQPELAQKHSFEKIAPVYKDMTTTGDAFVQVYRDVLEADKVAAAEAYGSAIWTSSCTIGLLAVIGTVVFVTIHRISRDLRQATTELKDGAEQVARAASQVSSSSQSLAQGSSEQAASLEETSASSQEISSMARRNTENSRSAAQLVTQSQARFVATNQSLDQMVGAMDDINTESDKISKIIKVIDEIAFQTNILALNAAVEAARAGEAGMGFAVVADEVRNLAQRCAEAARNTASMIEESIHKSNDGKLKVDQVATAIRSITEESAKVKLLVDEVNLGSEEQVRGIEQIGKTIIQMEQVTQASAANAQQSASAAEELNAQSTALRKTVEQLTVMVGGG